MKILQILNEGITEYQTKMNQAQDHIENMDVFSIMFNQRQDMIISEGIAYIDIKGVLLSDATQLDLQTGNTGYDEIKRDIEHALISNVEGIVFHINSPGGDSVGSHEIASMVQNLPVPSIAYIKNLGASAAYKIASAASLIMSSPSARVGGIGSLLVYQDISQMLQNLHVNYITFVNEGAIYKSIGHGNRDLTEEQMEYIQQAVTKSGNEFKEFVKENREVDDKVFTAAVFSGDEAEEVGLVDLIGDFDTTQYIAKRFFEIFPSM